VESDAAGVSGTGTIGKALANGRRQPAGGGSYQPADAGCSPNSGSADLCGNEDRFGNHLVSMSDEFAALDGNLLRRIDPETDSALFNSEDGQRDGASDLHLFALFATKYKHRVTPP